MEIKEKLHPNQQKVKCLHCDREHWSFEKDNSKKNVFCRDKCGAFGIGK